MGKKNEDSKSTSKSVSAPITPHFNINRDDSKRDDEKRTEVFEVKLNEPKSNNPFIRSILDISKDLPGSSETNPKNKP